MSLRSALAHRRAPWIAAALGIALALPSLGVGLVGDDYWQRAKLLRHGAIGAGARPLLDLFVFVPGDDAGRRALLDAGVLPWWTHPELCLAFLRPVSAATHRADLLLWPDAPALQHAHSLAWLGLALLLAGALYRRVHLRRPAIAGLAALLFALEDAHAMPTGWLANRNALVALAFGLLFMLGHLAWRRSGRALPLAGSLAALLAGLLAGEAALGAVAYAAAWQLTMERGGWWRRLLPLGPALALVAAWRLGYDLAGYGAVGSGLYLDPGGQPLRFAVALVERWPLLLMAQWSQFQSNTWALVERPAQIAMSCAAVVFCAGLAWLLRPLLRARPEARFWALGMGLSLVPLCAAFPMDRLLIYTGLGAFGLVALLTDHAGWLDAPRAGDSTRGRRVATGTLLALHGPLALAVGALGLLTLPSFHVLFAMGADEAPDDAAVADQTLVFVNGNEFPVVYTKSIRELDDRGRVAPARVLILSSMNCANRVEREDERTLVFDADGGLFQVAFDTLMRDPAATFAPGARVDAGEFAVEIRAVTDDGRPARFATTFREPLESASYRFLVWTADGLMPFALPAIGAAVEVPAYPLLRAYTERLTGRRADGADGP